MTTSNFKRSGATTCTEFRSFERRAGQKSLEDYWKSSKGITRRVDSLCQDFNYLLVNNAFKVVAPTLGATWMRWRDMGDDRVCPQCEAYASGGRGGFYHVTWFLPICPVHSGCRCQWEILFVEPEF